MVICLLSVIGIYKYLDTNYKNYFTISDVKWDGDARWWTENSGGNEYNIKFKHFNGKCIKKINFNKSNCDIKINSKTQSGDLNIKIYDSEKILFNKNGILDEIIKISNIHNKGVKIEITGKEAKSGYFKLKAM